jgi:outer membrane lipoprotein-sorting protein
MKRIFLLTSLAALPLAWTSASASMGVQEIVDKNVAARGGIAAWHNVQTLTYEGTLDAGGKPAHELPFVMKQKRPHKTRLEIVFKDQTAVQVYDGSRGWKVRPFLNRNEVEPYTPTELELAGKADELDGPLLDYQKKGTQVALDGTEQVDGHPAYKLRLTSRDGTKRALWIDSTTFLEVKMDGEPRKLDGRLHKVTLYFKDFRSEHGLTIPHVQQTVVEGVKEPYKMSISRISVNDGLEDAVFGKPQLKALVTNTPASPTAAPAAPKSSGKSS